MKEQEIKTMKLYHRVDRIERRLRDLGYAPDDEHTRVDPEQLGTMDSLHFFADEPIQRILALLHATGDSTTSGTNATDKKVLDIGTGYGGTARLLAHRSGCHVDALELQPDLSAAAAILTRKCGLESRITHKTGDVLELPIAPNTYNVAVGLLCFLHIGNWPALFQRCFDALQHGGMVYVEDFFLRDDAPLSAEDAQILRDDIYCNHLYARDELVTMFEKCGFEVVTFEDVTAKWRPYVTNRYIAYRADLAKHIAYDGEEVATKLDHFYASVAKVFQGDSVGGFQLTLRKPLQPPVA